MPTEKPMTASERAQRMDYVLFGIVPLPTGGRVQDYLQRELDAHARAAQIEVLREAAKAVGDCEGQDCSCDSAIRSMIAKLESEGTPTAQEGQP